MKLFLLKHRHDIGNFRDVAVGFVIAAEDEERARFLAAHNAGDEGMEAWMEEGRSSCTELNSSEMKEGVVIRDFLAG